MERLLRIASPLGLYAEEFEVERARHLGNFPQAFSHLALIEAAGRIILTELPGGAVAVTVAGARRRAGRRGLRAHARRRGRRRGAGRPQRLPPVPAAALPGGDVAAARRGHRPAAPDDLPRRTRPSRSSPPRSTEVDARPTAAVTLADGPDAHRVAPGDGRRRAARTSSASPAPPSTRSRSTPSPTPSGSGSTSRSSCERPASTRRPRTTGRSTSSWSAADPPGSRRPARSPS